MVTARELVGRDREWAELAADLEAVKDGRGGVVLLAGEGGVGKTRLAREVLNASDVLVLHGEASQEATPPYGPVVGALRSYLRHDPHGLADCGPLTDYLALLLPELGDPPPAADLATLIEAVRAAFLTIARRQDTAILLDDLHWADETSLAEVLPALASNLENEPALVVAIYRSDEIARLHPIRRLRRDLRRAGRLRELTLEPLAPEATAALAAQVLGEHPSRSLAAALHSRTQGIPFFVEELAEAMVSGDRVRSGPRGLELVSHEDVPLPETIRETVFLRTAQLSDEARAYVEIAAVAGLSFDLSILDGLAPEAGLEESVELGILAETVEGIAGFRHALTRDALYSAVPWSRRRALHRLLAERLTENGARSGLIAGHWLAAHDLRRACPALVAAAEEAAAVHAYRDALIAGRRAAEIWPEGEDEEARVALLERVGFCAQLGGELQDAVAAWREVAESRRSHEDLAGLASAQRQLATAYELQGATERTLAARQEAATSFSRAGFPGEAAAELVAAAAHLDSAGRLGAAVQLVRRARLEARRAGRRDLQARALGIEGTVRAKLGEIDAGLRAARAGLELALAEDATATAADAYQRLANVLENAADYEGAWDAYQSAFDFCEARGADTAAQICLVCLAFILLHTGEWDRALELDRKILASPHAPVGVRMGAKQHFGLVRAARGETRRARTLLAESGAYAHRYERQRMQIWDALGQGWLDEAEGLVEAGIERCGFILSQWGESESLHYPVPALRWATTFLATHAAEAEARACAAALAGLAGDTSNPEARAGLAHAVGEIALLDGDPERAVPQFASALTLLRELDLPFEAAQTQVRSGVALAAAGEREQAVAEFTGAYRTARKLGARPLAARVARELAGVGEPVERRLGRRAAAQVDGPVLTRREHEIIGLVALGQTNREIAGDLFLSTRTVDMHVRNILAKLSCRSRADATRKASELGLIA